jgi:hypothetical protein
MKSQNDFDQDPVEGATSEPGPSRWGRMHSRQGRPVSRGVVQALIRFVTFFIGLALLFGLPFHLGIKASSGSQVISAWKEVFQAAGMLTGTLLIFSTLSLAWRVTWIGFIIVMVGSWQITNHNAYFLISIEGLLLIGGGVAAGVTASQWLEGKIAISRPIAIILGLCILIFSTGILLNDVLGLTYRFTPDSETVVPWSQLREGMDRARFTMESPMGAGQFLWLCSILVAVAVTVARRLWQLILSACFLLIVAAALAKTGSRGPYVLFAASQFIFWCLMIAWGHTRIRRLAIVAPIVAVSAVLLFSILASSETKRAYSNILTSTSDSGESSNALRLQRIQEGVHVATENWPDGVGLFSLPIKYQLLRINFESHPLGVVAALGIWGATALIIQYTVLLLGIMAAFSRYKERDTRIAAYLAGVIPFISYTFLFPVGQDRYTSILLWLFLGASLGVTARSRFLPQPPN